MQLPEQQILTRLKRHWRTKGQPVRILYNTPTRIEAINHYGGRTLGFFDISKGRLRDVTV